LQDDGTLQDLVSDEAVLTRMLAPLGGSSSSSSTDAAAAATSSNEDAAAPAGSSSPGGAAAAGAGAASGNSSSSSGHDPDDSVREALAEAIAVLVRQTDGVDASSAAIALAVSNMSACSIYCAMTC
jgi:hypothetical protein